MTTTINKQAQDAAIAAVRDYGPTYNTEGLRIGLASVRTRAPARSWRCTAARTNCATSSTTPPSPRRWQGRRSSRSPHCGARAGHRPYSTWDGSSPRTIEGYTLQNYGNVSYGLSPCSRPRRTPSTPVRGTRPAGRNRQRAQGAIRAGVPRDTTGLKADPTTVLGTASPTALDMADAYATFAARGERADTATDQAGQDPDKADRLTSWTSTPSVSSTRP